MAKRVGRPIKPFVGTSYTENELKQILNVLKLNKTYNHDLIVKVKYDLKERKRLHTLYEKAKKRIFEGKTNN